MLRQRISTSRFTMREIRYRGVPPRIWINAFPAAAAGFFGILFLLIGVGAVQQKPNHFQMPVWACYSLFVFFCILTAGCVASLVVGLRRSAYVRATQENFDEADWRTDYSWSDTGITYRIGRETLLRLGKVLAYVPLMPVIHGGIVVAWHEKRGAAIGGGVILFVFDVFLLWLLFSGCRLAMTWLRYGQPYLEFRRCPFLLGESLEAVLQIGRQAQAKGDVVVRLHCFEEAIQTVETRQGSRSRLARNIRYEDEWFMTADEWNAETNAALSLSIPLPNKPELSTRLAQLRPRYWELHITVPGRIIDYSAEFLVPVYAAPAMAECH